MIDELIALRDQDEPMAYEAIATLWRFRGLEATKNNVLGKAHRLGLLSVGGAKVKTMFDRLDALASFPAAGYCVYPRGDRRIGYNFWGAKTAGIGFPYCPEHAARVYRAAGGEP